MAQSPASAKIRPDPKWFTRPGSCRPGGATGCYQHRSECIWKSACARFNLEMTQGHPASAEVHSIRSIVQANNMRVTFP